MARLAIAPLVLEAPGLDVTPTMIDRLKSVGKRWFDYMCGMDRLDPVSTWHSLVKRYFHANLKPPFNIAARNAARFSAAFYDPLAIRGDLMTSPKKRPNA